MSDIFKNILLIVNTLALGASILWIIKKPDYEPIISSLILIATLVSLLAYKTSEHNISRIRESKTGNVTIKKSKIGGDVAGRDIKK